jgi:hypothetical protein
VSGRLDTIVTEQPARRTATFARVERGGTGRFDLLVVQYDMAELVVRPQLSRYQADEAAKAINQAFITWLPEVL